MLPCHCLGITLPLPCCLDHCLAMPCCLVSVLPLPCLVTLLLLLCYHCRDIALLLPLLSYCLGIALFPLGAHQHNLTAMAETAGPGLNMEQVSVMVKDALDEQKVPIKYWQVPVPIPTRIPIRILISITLSNQRTATVQPLYSHCTARLVL